MKFSSFFSAQNGTMTDSLWESSFSDFLHFLRWQPAATNGKQNGFLFVCLVVFVFVCLFILIFSVCLSVLLSVCLEKQLLRIQHSRFSHISFCVLLQMQTNTSVQKINLKLILFLTFSVIIMKYVFHCFISISVGISF